MYNIGIKARGFHRDATLFPILYHHLGLFAKPFHPSYVILKSLQLILFTIDAHQFGLENCRHRFIVSNHSIFGLQTLESIEWKPLTQSRSGLDGAHIPVSIPIFGGYRQFPLVAWAHIQQSLIPPSIPKSISPIPYTFPYYPPYTPPFRPAHTRRKAPQEHKHSPLDHHSSPNLEIQRRPTIIARVELCPVARERATIVDGDGVASLRLSRAFFRQRVLGRDFGGERRCQKREDKGEGDVHFFFPPSFSFGLWEAR